MCLSINNIIIAAAKTGVIRANIRIARNSAILINGRSTFRFLRPGIANVRLVINKLVKEIVVVTPANITEIIAASMLPNPVNRIALEKGGINVQPANVKVLLLHFVKYIFLRRLPVTLVAINQKLSGLLKTEFQNNAFRGMNEKTL
jgi:hypothetical protein